MHSVWYSLGVALAMKEPLLEVLASVKDIMQSEMTIHSLP
jgi:hypothetical protein